MSDPRGDPDSATPAHRLSAWRDSSGPVADSPRKPISDHDVITAHAYRRVAWGIRLACVPCLLIGAVIMFSPAPPPTIFAPRVEMGSSSIDFPDATVTIMPPDNRSKNASPFVLLAAGGCLLSAILIHRSKALTQNRESHSAEPDKEL